MNWSRPKMLDAIYSKLRGFEVEIVEAPDLERPKQQAQAEPEEEEESRLDILDDPVQMYLRQMGKVPLLTREQEVQICKRIEEGETEARRILFGFGFTGKEHVALAEKLLCRSAPRAVRPRHCGQESGKPRHPSDRPAPPDQARARTGSEAGQGL